MTGGSLEPGDYAGKVLVVNFWNPFCGPCRREQPLLQESWERLRGRGVQMIGLMFIGGFPPWPDDPEAAQRYLRRFRVTYPVLRDVDSKFADGFGIQGIPTTVVVDRQGRMRFRVLGELKPGALDELIERLD
ncbi:MAG: TlpA family protein disulfide reductase [Actinomycetota bacterium]|nr:TlpA family protein disulfide reductase [Actinomycetota bacterium]